MLIDTFRLKRSWLTEAGLIVVTAAFALRLINLAYVGLGGDEAFGVYHARSGLDEIIEITATVEPHPPLYYAFLAFWHQLAGPSEFAIRFPSVAAGVLTAALLIRIGRTIGCKREGLLAAVLLALNPYQVNYAQEARMYGPLALFGLATIWLWLEAERSGRARYVVGSTLSAILAAYTHYYGLFLPAVIVAIFLFRRLARVQQGVPVRRWLLSLMAFAVAVLPWLAYARRISLSYWAAPPGSVDFAQLLRQSIVLYTLGPADRVLSLPYSLELACAIGAIAASGVLLPVILSSRRFLHASVVAATYSLIPLTLGLLVSLYRPMFAPRFLMVSAPAFYLMLSLGVSHLSRAFRPLAVLIFVFAIGCETFGLVAYYEDRPLKADFPKAIEYIRDKARNEDAIVLDGWTQTFQFWYYYTRIEQSPLPNYLFPLHRQLDENENAQALARIMSDHDGVWLLDYDVASIDPTRFIEGYLARNYYQAVYRQVGINRVVYYASGRHVKSVSRPLLLLCDSVLELMDTSISETRVRRGDLILIGMRLRAVSAVPRNYAISWRLTDLDGNLVYQRDSEPASGFAHTSQLDAGEELLDRIGIVIPACLPPGIYNLSFAIYDKTTGQAPRSVDRNGTLLTLPAAVWSIEVSPDPPVSAIDQIEPSIMTDSAFGGLMLVGCDVPTAACKPGDTIKLRLHWLVRDPSQRPTNLELQLVNDRGATVAQTVSPIGPTWFPVNLWKQSECYITFAGITIPPRAPGGRYSLRIAAESAPEEAKGLIAVPAAIQVVARERTFATQRPGDEFTATFSDTIELIGYEMDPTARALLRPGGILKVTLFWHCLRETPVSYKVFVHIIEPTGEILAQQDALPLRGAAPTNGWIAGEFLRDPYEIQIPHDAKPGRYYIEVGLYEPETGQRLDVQTGRSAIVLPPDIRIDN